MNRHTQLRAEKKNGRRMGRRALFKSRPVHHFSRHHAFHFSKNKKTRGGEKKEQEYFFLSFSLSLSLSLSLSSCSAAARREMLEANKASVYIRVLSRVHMICLCRPTHPSIHPSCCSMYNADVNVVVVVVFVCFFPPLFFLQAHERLHAPSRRPGPAGDPLPR